MKKTLLLLLLVITAIGAKAQDFGGKKNVGLGLGFNDRNQSLESVSLDSIPKDQKKISLLPSFAYFINNKWSIGVGARYSQSTNEKIINSYKSHLRDLDFGIEAFAIYHHWVNKRIALLAEPALGYSIDKYKITRELTGVANSTEDAVANYLYIKGRVGVLFVFNESISIDVSTSIWSIGHYSLKEDFHYSNGLNQISESTHDARIKTLSWGEKKNVRISLKYIF